MTGRGHRLMGKMRSWVCWVGAVTGRQLRALMPPMTARLLFRALLGILLFFCGIILGAWLIIRFRRQVQDSRP